MTPGRSVLRLAMDQLFPEGFENAKPSQQKLFLAAAKELEAQKVISLCRRKGDRINSLVCLNIKKLSSLAGKKMPPDHLLAARHAAGIAGGTAGGISGELFGIAYGEAKSGARHKTGDDAQPFFRFIADNLTEFDMQRGADARAVEDLALLYRSIAANPGRVTSRAFSIFLFHDVNRIEQLKSVFAPIFGRARKLAIPVPAIIFPGETTSETMAGGNLIFLVGRHGAETRIATKGAILGVPVSTAREIRHVQADTHRLHARNAGRPPSVLMLENKEIFYALTEGSSTSLAPGLHYDGFLYTGGYPNRATGMLVQLFSRAGFSLYHAGDLDPHGILILQDLRKIAGRPITPVLMDAATFDRYLPWGKKLPSSSIGHLALVDGDFAAQSGVEALLRRIHETGKGIEQEVIDYRV
ncbi:MAG: DUF2220 domain-containing protein [Spirochaetaceae bacterium]|nr:DUF2220 domain-containing protein [Spirochaetaceae bacterium]